MPTDQEIADRKRNLAEIDEAQARANDTLGIVDETPAGLPRRIALAASALVGVQNERKGIEQQRLDLIAKEAELRTREDELGPALTALQTAAAAHTAAERAAIFDAEARLGIEGDAGNRCGALWPPDEKNVTCQRERGHPNTPTDRHKFVGEDALGAHYAIAWNEPAPEAEAQAAPPESTVA